jgi:hypothetical protein
MDVHKNARTVPHVLANGRVIRPEIEGGVHRFRLPTGARDIRLVSRSATPAELGTESGDHRRLGVAVSRIALDGTTVALDDPRLGAGWYGLEPAWRWTDGDGGLALAEGRLLEVEVALTARYWIEPDRRQQRAA